MKIQKTTNYDKFKFIRENRGIYKSNLKKLKESILAQNLLEANPVIVNEKMEVIDGQHRIEVCEALKIPVYYVKVAGTGMKEVVLVNTAAKNWSLRDYIFSYIKQGNKNYEYVRDLQQNNHIPYQLGAEILSNNYNRKAVSEKIKNGTFEVKPGRVEWAEGFCITLEKFRKLAPLGVKNDRLFTTSIVILFREFPTIITKLLENLEYYGFQIKRFGSEKAYLEFFEESYNFHRKTGFKASLV
jgi:hypothetical protein